MEIIVSSFICGFLLSIGLGTSGMVDPNKIINFLDVFSENFDPTLLFVMIGALLISAPSFYVIKKRKKPVFDDTFYLPKTKEGTSLKTIDQQLILGSALFGIGWGLAGICPGPAVVGMTSGRLEFIIFIASMVIGMYGYKVYFRFFDTPKKIRIQKQ